MNYIKINSIWKPKKNFYHSINFFDVSEKVKVVQIMISEKESYITIDKKGYQITLSYKFFIDKFEKLK